MFNFTENSSILQAADTLNLYVPNKYLQAVLILLVIFLLSKLFVGVVKTVVLAVTHKTKTKMDDLLVEETKGPVSWLLITVGARLALIPLELQAGSVGVLSRILNTVSILLITVLLIRVVNIVLDVWGTKIAKKTSAAIDDILLPIFQKASKVVFVILGIFFVFSVWDIDLTGILAGVGIAGLALGFAVKDSLANIFGGIALLLDEAIKVGDYIEIEGTSGEVVDIGLRSTRIRTWDNELLIIPNGTLANTSFKNWKLPNLRARITIKFGVEYGVQHEKVRKIIYEAIKKHANILKDPAPVVRFKEMGDSALIFAAYVWVDDISEKVSTKERVVSGIYDALNKHKIGIPYPQMDVHLKKK